MSARSKRFVPVDRPDVKVTEMDELVSTLETLTDEDRARLLDWYLGMMRPAYAVVVRRVMGHSCMSSDLVALSAGALFASMFSGGAE